MKVTWRSAISSSARSWGSPLPKRDTRHCHAESQGQSRSQCHVVEVKVICFDTCYMACDKIILTNTSKFILGTKLACMSIIYMWPRISKPVTWTTKWFGILLHFWKEHVFTFKVIPKLLMYQHFMQRYLVLNIRWPKMLSWRKSPSKISQLVLGLLHWKLSCKTVFIHTIMILNISQIHVQYFYM